MDAEICNNQDFPLSASTVFPSNIHYHTALNCYTTLPRAPVKNYTYRILLSN
jgi:hypothetical protein